MKLLEALSSKEPLGRGAEHIVYSGLYDKDKVYKVPVDEESRQNMARWIKLFKENPIIFPKIYKVGENYVALEKLNTAQVKDELNQMWDFFTERGILDEDSLGYDVVDLLQQIVFLGGTIKKQVIDAVKADPKIKKIFTRWLDTMNKIRNVMVNTVGPKDEFFDIHSNNFGYDSKGNLKLLDI